MGARDPNDYLTRQTTDIIEKKKKTKQTIHNDKCISNNFFF